MPPSTADDPPLSPLPAPRGTTGTRCAAAQRTAVLHLAGVLGADDGRGRAGAAASRDQS